MLIEPRFEKELRKWGSSLGVVVPKNWLDAVQAQEGDTIVLEIKAVRKSGLDQGRGPSGDSGNAVVDFHTGMRLFDGPMASSSPSFT